MIDCFSQQQTQQQQQLWQGSLGLVVRQIASWMVPSTEYVVPWEPAGCTQLARLEN